MSSATSYTKTAIGLHWLLALALLVSFAVGTYMTGLPFSPQRLKLYNWHKWAGVCILALSALRLLWRVSHPRVPLPETITRHMPAWQHMAHVAVHAGLYVLFFAVPLIGWAYSSALGFPIVLFGVWPLPDFMPVDKALAEVIKPWHQISAYAMATLVCLHVGGALKHHFIDRDGLLRRMAWPRRQPHESV